MFTGQFRPSTHHHSRMDHIMSQQSMSWLNRNVLVGQTDRRGHAWHYRAELQGAEQNHYAGFIPVADVHRRLFDWDAVSVPSFVMFEGRMIPTGEASVIASDNGDVLGNNGLKYGVHGYGQWLVTNVQNTLSHATDSDGIGITSAGLLLNRSIAWVEVSVPDSIVTPEGVTFRPNLLATTSMNGTCPTTYKRTRTDTVCDNTRACALAEQSETFKVRHTVKSEAKAMDVRAALNLLNIAADDSAAEIAALAAWKVSPRAFGKVLDLASPLTDDMGKAATTRSTNYRDAIASLYGSDERVAPWNGTAYGVVQAFNTYRTHERGTREGAWSGGVAERAMVDVIKGNTDKADREVLSWLSAATNRRIPVLTAS